MHYKKDMYIIVCTPHIDTEGLLFFRGLKGCQSYWPEREFFEWCEEMDVAYIKSRSSDEFFTAPSTSEDEAAYIRSLLPRGLKRDMSVVVFRFRGRSARSFVPYSFGAMWNYIDRMVLGQLCDLLIPDNDDLHRRKLMMMEGQIFDNVILVTPI